jgi:hypothetical protein
MTESERPAGLDHEPASARETLVAQWLQRAVPEPPALPGLFDQVAARVGRRARRRRVGVGFGTVAVAAGTALALALGGLPGMLHLGRDGDVVADPSSSAADHGSPGGGTGTAPVPTAEANSRLARAEAQRLLALAPTPPGLAGPLAEVPAELGELGPVVRFGVVRLTQTWRVERSEVVTRHWLRQHPPADMIEDFQNTATDSGVVVQSVGYRLALTGDLAAALASARLVVYQMALSPQASAMRVDVEVVWLDPTPWPDDAVHPLRLTTQDVALACPKTLRDTDSVSNPGATGAGLDRALLPAATPTGAVVCAYSGWPGGISPRRTVLGGTAATQLAEAVRRIPLAHPAFRSSPSCASMLTTMIVVLRYPGRPDVDLWLLSGGCANTRNGVIKADAAPAIDLQQWAPIPLTPVG